MSNQDLPQYLGSFLSPDFPDNDIFGDMPTVEPLNSLLFHNVFGHTGRSVIHSSIQSHPGLGRGRIPVLNSFLNRPIIDTNTPFFDPQQHPFPARLVNHIERIRTQVPVPARALLQQPAPHQQPAPQPAANGRNRKRRASEKAISELRHMRLIDLKEEDDCCIICMETFVDIKASTDEPKRENALQMPCGHIFGSHCLRLWLKDHSTCPTCRKEVDFIEEDERGERTAVAMNRRRNGGIERDMQQAAGLANRYRNMQHARDQAEISRNRLVEVEVIVQRQRYATPHTDPAAQDHGAENAGWMTAGPHVPLQQQFSHYPQYLGIGALPDARIEQPMNNRHDQPARLLGVPGVQQPLPRSQYCNNHPRVINHRAGPPRDMFNPRAMHTFHQRHQQHQSTTMPQRSQSQRQLQRQLQSQPYPEINMANRGSVTPNPEPVNPDIYSPRIPVPGYIPANPVSMQDHPEGAHQNQNPTPKHYQAGGVGPYSWDSNTRRWQRQQHQQSQQTFLDPSSSQMLDMQLSNTRIVCPAAAALHPPLQPPHVLCDYIDMSMCQHQFTNTHNSNAGNIGVLPPDQTQIIHLSCGHGFHRECLLSTMKSRAPIAIHPAKWLCGKCGRYVEEMGTKRAVGQAHQLAG